MSRFMSDEPTVADSIRLDELVEAEEQLHMYGPFVVRQNSGMEGELLDGEGKSFATVSNLAFAHQLERVLNALNLVDLYSIRRVLQSALKGPKKKKSD